MALSLHFDRQTYTCAKPERSSPLCTNLKTLLNEVIGEGHGYCNNRDYKSRFNDLSFYMDLCARKGCTKVEISSISVLHKNNFCCGLQAIYRSTFSNGSSKRIPVERHMYCGGSYAYVDGNQQRSSMILREGEHLAEIRTRQGEIIDQITFITNQRTLSFVGNGGSSEDMSAPPDLSRRIVAFVGTSNEVLERLGAISVSINWEEVGHLVLLRTLVEKNRASVVLQDDNALGEEDAVIVQRLITNTDGDLFKRIVSFLGYGMKVSD